MIHRLRASLLLCVLTGATCAATRPPASGRSQQGPSKAPAEDSQIQADPNVVGGTLENGFTYYVRRDAGRGAYVALIVKVGEANESDEQRGLAHLVTHMAFAGTPRFDEAKLADFLRGLGLSPTADQYVATNLDFTAYGLPLPASSGDVLPIALDLLADWSTAIPFDAARIERERRAVLEEAAQAPPDRQLARQILDTLLRERAPVAAGVSSGASGTPDKAGPDQIVGFHKSWYRPERMAIIAIGDLEPKRLEEAIRQRFAPIRAPGPSTEAGPSFTGSVRDTSFAVLPAPEPKKAAKQEDDDDDDDEPEDKAAPIPTVISLAFKQPRSPLRTEADLRRSVVEDVYGALVQARIDKIVRRAGSPLRTARWFRVPQVPFDLSVLQAAVKPWRLETGLRDLWAELGQIGRSGFTAGELADALRGVRSSAATLSPSEPRAARMISAQSMTAHFLYGDVLFSPEARRNLEQKLLGQIGFSEVNDFARSTFGSSAKSVVASGPRDQLLSKEDLRAVVARAENAAPGPAPAGVLVGSLLDALPTPGSVVEESSVPEVGAVVWKLSNGATVVTKATAFKPGEILLQARAPGGTSLASDRDYWSATLAPQIVSAGGLGRHDPQRLRALLDGRAAEGHPWISETEQGISAKAAPEDLEIMLQLVHLGFTAPRKDPESFEELREHFREQLQQRNADPNQVFADSRRSQSFGNHPRRRAPTAKSVRQVRLDGAVDFYRQRFSRASDFTFVLVGDIDRDRLKPLVERYLASLPNAGPEGHWRDVGARLANGVKRIHVEQGSDDRSTVTLTFHREASWSREAEAALEALRGYLEIRAREALSFQPVAARSLSVTAAFERTPVPQSSLMVSFDSSRALVDESKRALLRLIEEVKDSPARPAEVATVREARKRRLEREWETNAFWLDALTEQYASRSDPRDIQRLRTAADQVDVAMIERAARDYLDLGRYIEAVRLPRRK